VSYEAIAVRLPGIGSKRVCVSCATRFYDLARTPPVCPKCGTEQPPEVPRPPPIRRSPSRRMMKAPAPAARDPDDDAAPVLDTDEDEVEADEDAEVVEEEADEESDAEAVLDEPEP
jgi:uncharacterized protein (TIGR02300 family)